MEESWSLCLHTIFGFEGVLRGGGGSGIFGGGGPRSEPTVVTPLI